MGLSFVSHSRFHRGLLASLGCRVAGLAAAAGLAATATPAGAVDVVLTGTTAAGTVCSSTLSGITACNVLGMTAGQQVTFTWSLSSPQALNGYDIHVEWDPDELTPVSCTPLYPDTQPPGTPEFVGSPCPALPTDPPEGDAASVSLVALQTTGLFSMTFEVTSTIFCDADDEADLFWTPNGAAFSPTSVVLDNPAGAGADFGVVEAACNDGVDNDLDGNIDFDGGACAGLPLGSQTAPDPHCTVPTKNKEKNGCGLGFEIALLLAPLLIRRRVLRVSR
jgi:hypothetical protein